MVKKTEVSDADAGSLRAARKAQRAARLTREEGSKAAVRASERREDPMIAAGKETLKAQASSMKETAKREGGYTK